MITEELLERGLAAAAEDYDVPTGAVDRLREHIAPQVQRRRLPRPTRRGWIAIAGSAAVALVVLPFALGGSGAGSAPAASPPKSARLADHGPVAAGAAGTTTAGGGSASLDAPSTPGVTGFGAAQGTAQGTAVAPVPSVPDRVIKTGELDLQVSKGQVGHTLDQLTALATLERGYVANSRTSEGGFAPSGEVTLRVPVGVFDDAVTRARHLAGVKVLGLQTSGQDVTAKYVDVAARIKALQATRETFLTLLAKATTIGETLAVQQHVTDVQTQIEQLQGQLKVLANRSAMSTLTVTVDQKVTVPPKAATHHKSGFAKAIDRSVSRFVRGFEAIIGILGTVLLVGLLMGLGWLVVRVAYRRLRRQLV